MSTIEVCANNEVFGKVSGIVTFNAFGEISDVEVTESLGDSKELIKKSIRIVRELGRSACSNGLCSSENAAIDNYDATLELAFYGQGGQYVKDEYETAIRGGKTLSELVNNEIDDARSEMSRYGESSHSFLCDIDEKISDDVVALQILEKYLDQAKCSYPELCGEIAGIMFRNGERDKVLEFLQVDDLHEPRYWDS